MPISWHGADIANEIGKRIDAQMMDLGAKVVAEAVRFAPKRTGALAQSLTFDYNLSTHTLIFTSDIPYDIFQEYGTRNMLPHPHWRPALHTVGEVYGFNLELAFANVPHIRDPLLAAGPTFYAPKTLTPKQREHVKHALKPVSTRLWHGRTSNVSRTKMGLRKY